MFDVQNVSCISGLRRNLQLDGVQDLYDRNLFVDHLIPPHNSPAGGKMKQDTDNTQRIHLVHIQEKELHSGVINGLS